MAPVVTWNPIEAPAAGPAAAPPPPGVRAPWTIPQTDFLTSRLDPNSATWIGAPGRAAIRAASTQLQAGLQGYGNFDFGPEDQFGQRQVTQRGGNPGEKYRRSAVDARAQANASGMLYSRTADQAVGEAWFRLSEQQRALVNQYGSVVTSSLNQMAADTSNVLGELSDLYGQDIRYALENPQDLPSPAVAPGAPGAPGALDPATGGVNSGNAGRATGPAPRGGMRGEAVGGNLSARQVGFLDPARAGSRPPGGPDMGGPDTPGGNLVGRMVDGRQVAGVYASAPNRAVIRRRFGPNAEVRRTGDGRYIVLREVY